MPVTENSVAQLDNLAEKIQRQRGSENVSADVERAAQRVLADVRPEMRRLSGNNAYRKWIRKYVREQSQRFKNGERSEPVCDCRSALCDLKEGKLPGAVLDADTIDAGIDRFERYHTTAPVLLEAQQEFDTAFGRVEERLSSVYAMLDRDLNGHDDPLVPIEPYLNDIPRNEIDTAVSD